MQKICSVSGKNFKITQEDLAFYKRVGVPTPTLCPEERERRRLAWRNERKIYWRTCDISHKKILSIYSPDKKLTVYDHNYWWSDKFNALEYGQEFDVNKKFFEQFLELLKRVPHNSINVHNNENSEYSNHTADSKNCYLMFASVGNEDCLFGNYVNTGKDCVDCFSVRDGELNYECIDCVKNYNLKFSELSENCTDSSFLFNCKSCENCFMSSNLRQKKYFILNQKYSKEQYFKILKEINLGNNTVLKDFKEKFKDLKAKTVRKFMEGQQNENVTGNLIYRSKNCQECFDTQNSEDCKFLGYSNFAKNTMDAYAAYKSTEMCYETIASGGGTSYGNKFCYLPWGATNLEYCVNVFFSQDCFGCTGLKKNKYCILNTQYSKEEYFILKEKIIEHMKVSGEYGEFFPMELSPFGYNETIAQEYFPLENFSEKNLKYNWKPEEILKKSSKEKINIPEDIKNIKDDICEKMLICEITGKNYKIQKEELKFYRKMNLPIPRICPEERHKERLKLRNPRKLWQRTCDNEKCKDKLQFVSTFSPERTEKVYCQDCYLKSVN